MHALSKYALSLSSSPRTIVIDGITIAYHDSDRSGQRPVILCLHAIGHGSRDFESLQQHWSASYRIIALDWPGQGRSSSDPKPASIDRYTELLETFIQELGLKELIIVGNSIGGGVAIQLASQRPRLVRALILCNPAGLDKGGLLAKVFMGSIELRMRSGMKPSQHFDSWFQAYYEKVLITPAAAEQRKRIVAARYELVGILAEAWQSFWKRDADLRPLIESIEAPVLFAWAEQDAMIQFSRNKAAIARFKHHSIQMFPAGHSPFLETPEAFNESMGRFLASLSRLAA